MRGVRFNYGEPVNPQGHRSSVSHYHRMLFYLLFWTSLFLLITNGERGFYGNHYGEWNDSQLQPTIQKLMKGYNRYLRPNFNQGPVEIGMSLDIASIDAISEINMDYTATIFLRQRWRDSRLVFPGNESLSLDGRLVSLLWIPDTFIPDSKRSFLHDVTVENRLIRIFSNGTVLYALRITATIACNMDLTKYPMDKQECTLQLESWGYNLQDVVFYWTRGNDSVKGLDTLRLAQYSVESYYTSVSEAVYETGVTTVLTMTTLMMGARTSLPNANCFIKAIDVYLGICFTFIFGALLEYACAHFCTMQHQTIVDVQRELLKEFEESNGTTHMANSISPKKMQTEESTQQETSEQSVTCEGNEDTDKNQKGCAIDMDTMIYLDQENGRLTTPAIKSRQNRLHSAPDQCLRTPLTGKARLGAPLQSSRKALGVINKVVATPAASQKAEQKTKPEEVKCKAPAQPAGAELPEIEKCFPYNPSEFETYSVPDEVYLSRFSLAGLGKQTWPTASPVEELLEPCLPLSPLKIPRVVEYVDEMEAFLQTINELTVDLPPECEL
ncbi:gamma-aminobutyric acid receptor subunit pi-like protein [Labeo rohita]|uniref:Gamma-aminobutyric acid receptor subunit pi n=1 Tax=Labeo rohita TaxID=84645 RepID=A0A498MRW7_LABRO|nr:gamma-aminobutyric acid receptor subunit pi-like protein [Labeo rohita]